MAKHALLSASSADRWLNCTPSARLNEAAKDRSSPYAALGTLAHELSEILLKRDLQLINRKEFDKQFSFIQEHELFYPGMVDEVEDYTSYVIEKYHSAVAKSSDAVILLEEKVDFSSYVPEGFGTGDCIIIADGELEIIDLKFGQGVEVSPVDNAQLKLYALGAYDRYGFIYDIDKITMTIAQVRLNNISSSTITTAMLELWAEQELREKAVLAYEGKGETNPGHWCTFCKVMPKCSKKANQHMGLYQSKKDTHILKAEEIAELLLHLDDIEKWAKGVKEHALLEALKGENYTGFKLVEGRSNRVINDETALAKQLISAGFKEEQIYKPVALEGLTNLEKVVGKKKFTELASGFISKPAGKPALVPETDKRVAIDSVESDFFND